MAASTDSLHFSDSLNVNKTHHLPSVVAPLESTDDLEEKVSNGLLIGPSDRKRFGDQLRPHVFSRIFDLDSYRCVGLVSKDLSPIGGHNVINFGEAALEMDRGQHSIVHMGGDAMLTGLITGYHRAAEGSEENRFTSLVQVAAREEMIGYVKRRSGQRSSLAYVLAPEGCYSGSEVTFFGLRLPEPSVLEDDQEEHLVYCAGEAPFFGVSGKAAEEFFQARGIECVQMPCALSVLPRVCGKRLNETMRTSRELNELSQRFERGWIAVEVGEIPKEMEVDFANTVSSFAASKGWGIVVYTARHLGEDKDDFRDGWLELLGESAEVSWFQSNNIWEMACLIGNANFYVGSCLDSRIIAGAFCVPRINTSRPDDRNADYCHSWESPSIAAVLGPDRTQWFEELKKATEVDLTVYQEHAEATYQSFFNCISLACQKSTLQRAPFVGEKLDHHAAIIHGQQFAAEHMLTESGRRRFFDLSQSREIEEVNAS